MLQMKKTFKRAAFLSVAALYIAVSAGLFDIISKGARATPLPSSDSSVSVFAPSEGEVFIVRETNGVIGVFVNGEDEPRYTLDVFVFTLPEDEQELLSFGIECDAEGLSYLLDSYGS